MAETIYVPIEKFIELAPLLLPLIERAMEYSQGEYSLDDVIDGVLDKKMQLWGVVDGEAGIVGAAITRVIQAPGLTTLQIMYVGGTDMREWGPSFDATLNDFGKTQGCTRLQACGRHGWAKALKPQGYSQDYVVMGKAIK
jgi:hypothetical protein